MTTYFHGRAALLALVSVLSLPVLAQQPAPIDNVTIIGDRNAVRDLPGSAQLVDKELLDRFLDADILRVLRVVPGVYLQEEEGFGLRPNIGIRGSGLDRSARIALLEDGVLIAPAPYSAPAAYYFPTQRRMHAVEVLKGPASITVGPRTTGGAINLLSTPIPDAGGASADLRIGDHGSRDVHLNVGGNGQTVSWLLETVQSGSDGFKHIDGPVGGDTGFRLQDYLAKLRIGSLYAKAGYTEQSSDETYLGLTDEDFAEDPFLRYAASAGDVFDSEHEQYRLGYVFDRGERWQGEITAYRNEFHRNWYKLQAVNGTGIGHVLTDPAFETELSYLKGATSPDDAISKRANNRNYLSQGLQGHIERNFEAAYADVRLTAGFRIHEDEEDRLQHEDNFRMQDGTLIRTTAGAPGSNTNRLSSADVRSAYVDAEIRRGKWILTPGFRFESIDMERRDFSTSDPSRGDGATRVRQNSVSAAIGGIGALYRLNSHWRLLGGIHEGFNPPAPGSSSGAESSLNVEIGARYDRNALSVESIYFINDYANLVGTVTDSTGGGGTVGDQYDGGSAIVSGLELSAGYLWRAGRFDIPLDIDYTWTAKAEFRNAFDSDFGPWGNVVDGDELPYIPEHQLRVNGGLLGERWRLNLGASYVGDLRTTAGQGPLTGSESIDSRVIWDAVAAWNLTPAVAAYVKVDNLLDETYIAARRPAGVRPGLPRTAYLGLTVRL